MYEEAEILNRFYFHPATPTTGGMHDMWRIHCQTMARLILDTIPPGRHQSLALTALQETMMWGNAAIACDTEGTH